MAHNSVGLTSSVLPFLTTCDHAVMLHTLLAVAAAALVFAGPQQAPPPNINVPPGYQAKVTKETVSYNFHGLTRDLRIPLDAVLLTPPEFGSGVRITPKLEGADPKVDKLVKSPAGALPKFGMPMRSQFQCFKGAAVGTIVYLEYAKPLPADMREQLAKYFYGTTELKKAPQTIEFLANDHLVIVWNFAKPESVTKGNSQKKVFELVSQIASQEQAARKNAKKK